MLVKEKQKELREQAFEAALKGKKETELEMPKELPCGKKSEDMPLDIKREWEKMRKCYFLLKEKKATVKRVRVGDHFVNYTSIIA